MTDDAFRWVIAAAVILACIAFLVQAGITIALFRIMKRTSGKIIPLADRAEPVLNTARQILEENRPRASEISAEAVVIVKNIKEQTARVSELLKDTSDKAQARIAQIDKTVDETVEQVEHVGDAVKGAVMRPVREVNAVMAGVRAALITYAQGGRRPSVDHATQDEEMFI